MVTNFIETNSTSALFEANNLFKVTFKQNMDVEKVEVVDILKKFKEISSEQNKLKLLIISGKDSTISKEAREFCQQLVLPLKCEAVVVNSLAQKIIAKFYIRVKNGSHPAQVFDNQVDAFDWLATFD